jgi:hypothetical protein
MELKSGDKTQIQNKILAVKGGMIGLVICSSRAEVVNMPVNNSVMFVREGDVIVTNDLWKAVLFRGNDLPRHSARAESGPKCCQENSR